MSNSKDNQSEDSTMSATEPSKPAKKEKKKIKKKASAIAESVPSTSGDINDKEEVENSDEDAKKKKLDSAGVEKGISSGVVYLSSIPPFMSVSRLRMMLSKYGELGRIYLQPDTKNKRGADGGDGKKSRRFTEGWVEYKNKKVAKRVASTLNNSQVGGNRRAKYYDSLWCIKYLHRFKWTHLNEQLRYESEVRKQRSRVEISQAKRKASFFASQVEKGSSLRRLEEVVLKKGGLWEKYQRQIKQKSGINDSKQKDEKSTEGLLDMILGE